MRNKLLAILLMLPSLLLAQESDKAFHFLRLPYSSHAAALGGSNVSLPDDDIMLSMHNPALLANVSDRTLD